MTSYISIILLAGGTGSRMQTTIPKQFLELQGKMIAAYSLELFLQLPGVAEIVLICESPYRHFFKNYSSRIPLKFANPGPRRQDSVFNGLKEIDPQSTIACIHDAVRPFTSMQVIKDVITAAVQVGAAAAAVPLKFTVKEADAFQNVISTPDRSKLWEVQTPQAVRVKLLSEGFAYVTERQLTVTDDVSLVELMGLPVKLVPSCYTNIKVTTPDDLSLAKLLVDRHL